MTGPTKSDVSQQACTGVGGATAPCHLVLQLPSSHQDPSISLRTSPPVAGVFLMWVRSAERPRDQFLRVVNGHGRYGTRLVMPVLTGQGWLHRKLRVSEGYLPMHGFWSPFQMAVQPLGVQAFYDLIQWPHPPPLSLDLRFRSISTSPEFRQIASSQR